MNKQLDTPVLFLAFNRPEVTAKVFDSIRAVQPKRLYVAIDGPREGRQDDIDKRKKVLEIVHNVDWPCDALYLVHDKNKGCSMSGYLAWKWLFEHEDRMIFIEDDGLGNVSAFRFVEEMLNRYEADERIAYVGAVNYGPKYGNGSYYISRPPAATYFMGTWKRVFNKYEYEVESFPRKKYSLDYIKHFNTLSEYLFITTGIDQYYKSVKNRNRLNTYDQQMIYLSYLYNMYSIYPNINMVSNIGLDGGANNHYDEGDPFYKEYGNRERFECEKIIHPETLNVDKNFEISFFKKRCLYNKPWFGNWVRVIMPTRLRSFLRYIKQAICKGKK